MINIKLILGLTLIGLGYFYSRPTQSKIVVYPDTKKEPSISPSFPNYMITEREQKEVPEQNKINYFDDWKIPQSGLPYKFWLNDAERIYNIPHNLLARVAYQESRFRDDIITGKTISSAGAQGIMQIIPRWHPTANPLNPKEAIYYAGSYLRRLYNRFGSWPMALAGYNWGPTNLENKGLANAPYETQNYVAEITRDIKVT